MSRDVIILCVQFLFKCVCRLKARLRFPELRELYSSSYVRFLCTYFPPLICKLGSLYLLNSFLSVTFELVVWSFAQNLLLWNWACEQKNVLKHNLSKFCFEVNRAVGSKNFIIRKSQECRLSILVFHCKALKNILKVISLNWRN